MITPDYARRQKEKLVLQGIKPQAFGIVSIVLLASGFVYPHNATWAEPIVFASIWLSALFGFMAGRRGSRWWFAVPAVIVIGVVIGLVVNVP